MGITKSFGELVKLAFISISVNFVGYLFYCLLTYLGSNPKATMTFFYVMGTIIGFWCKKKFVFAHDGNIIKTGMKYFIVQSIGYFVCLTVFFIVTDNLGYPHQLAQGVSILILIPFLFIAFKFFVFPKNHFSFQGSK